MSLKEKIALKEVLNKDKQFFELLTKKVKASKKVHSCRNPGTKFLERKLFQFDNFDVKVSFYDTKWTNLPKEFTPGKIKDIMVKDKSGNKLAYIDCELNYEGAEKINESRLKLCNDLLDLMRDKEKADLKKKAQAKEMKKATKNMQDTIDVVQRLHKEQSSQMSQALDSIKNL